MKYFLLITYRTVLIDQTLTHDIMELTGNYPSSQGKCTGTGSVPLVYHTIIFCIRYSLCRLENFVETKIVHQNFPRQP